MEWDIAFHFKGLLNSTLGSNLISHPVEFFKSSEQLSIFPAGPPNYENRLCPRAQNDPPALRGPDVSLSRPRPPASHSGW